MWVSKEFSIVGRLVTIACKVNQVRTKDLLRRTAEQVSSPFLRYYAPHHKEFLKPMEQATIQSPIRSLDDYCDNDDY